MSEFIPGWHRELNIFDHIKSMIILDAQIRKVILFLKQDKQISLRLSVQALKVLSGKSMTNLDNGARGIGNIVESLLINPLSRYLFDHGITGNKHILIEDIQAEHMPYSLHCTVKE